MKFKELDTKMRTYETNSDSCVLPGVYMVARIDGRCFTKLTKDTMQFEAPYDIRFRDLMIETVKHLMQCGFKVNYGYTQSDEISLLFDLNENAFGRKDRKFNSILAGEASARFSLMLGKPGVFDCRISQLPNQALVADYFRWRNEDASRNCLNAYCYWTLREEGLNPTDASSLLLNKSVAEKNEFLFQRGVNFNEIPNWQKRGVGIYWEAYKKNAVNPITQEPTVAIRNRIKVDLDIPFKDSYNQFVARFM
ncbi:tRNA(His) guanylyltransferase Thg1 family protein [Pleionea sediminis]|uniref:tRNA(His) guanylyltransferase Thg1 family protein n=1 Tax=Pleionea sediminis TaxID=2569479 RepID=UPI0011870455|nr:tRNA(His) guanylyltransferase Thg1 family protein [Pleionea sediminis]